MLSEAESGVVLESSVPWKSMPQLFNFLMPSPYIDALTHQEHSERHTRMYFLSPSPQRCDDIWYMTTLLLCADSDRLIVSRRHMSRNRLLDDIELRTVSACCNVYLQ
jgi:hypothetical protein